MATTTLKRVGSTQLYTLQSSIKSFFYESGFMIDADGAYKAYHPQPDSSLGLDYLANAGHPGNWWALVTDNGEPSGNPIIQGDSDPAPGFYISTTSLEDTALHASNPRRYVDASSINFIVLPGGLGEGNELGDFAVVINPKTEAIGYAVYADVGPHNQIGEGSIALANSIGIPGNPKNGGVGHGIVWIVFPASKQGWPLTQEQINTYAQELFEQWGGLAQAKACFPDVPWGQ